jgi:hypothetical protein
MKQRLLVVSRALPVLMAAAWLAPVLAQAPSSAAGAGAPARTWKMPRTPDGQPDLQGFWTNSTYTPLERPGNVTKEFYTKEEAAEIEKRAAAQESEQTEPGTVADVHYDFSQFGLDRNQSPLARTLRTSLIVDPAEGRLPSLTPEGKRRAAERAELAKRVGRWDSAQSNDLDDRCLIMAGAGPPMLNSGYNSNYQIVQAQGYVMILVEMIHDVRIIPLDRRPHLPGSVRQWMGDSRGYWEGDTLVVETTNFNGKNPLRGSSEKMRVAERFTRVDANTISYRFTVEDESTWTRPWTAELPMKKTAGPLFEHACHEGNYGLYNTLVGARLEEKKAAEEAAKKGSKQ